MKQLAIRFAWFMIVFSTSLGFSTAQSQGLDIYWIDVEGGAATLLVSPEGESLLVDTGFPTDDKRDARRIAVAMREAGLTKIDHLVITHYHRDHVGGLEALAEIMPIERCYDHGTTTDLTIIIKLCRNLR